MNPPRLVKGPSFKKKFHYDPIKVKLVEPKSRTILPMSKGSSFDPLEIPRESHMRKLMAKRVGT